VKDRNPIIKNKVLHFLLQQMCTIYFEFRVSRVLGLLLSIFSEMIFPKRTNIYCTYMPSTTMVSSSYLFGTLKNVSFIPSLSSTQISASCSPTDGPDFLYHFGFLDFCLLYYWFPPEKSPTKCMDLLPCVSSQI
jgi:hypothetical protein